MARKFFLILLTFGFSMVICTSSQAQETSSGSIPRESTYTVYRQINTADYLPEENYTVAQYTRPRIKKAATSRAKMNIPMSFAALGMVSLLIIFIYVIGLMLHDMSREDPFEVEEAAESLLLIKEKPRVSTWQKPQDS